MPPLRALVSHMPPKQLDADKVIYGFLVAICRAWEPVCRLGPRLMQRSGSACVVIGGAMWRPE
jgi:hypothetical protein